LRKRQESAMLPNSVIITAILAVVCGFCAKTEATPPRVPRLIGGEITDISVFPHQLSLQLYDAHVCGASAIAATWALVSASCLSFGISAFSLVGGSTNKSDNSGTRFDLKDFFIHPEFIPGSFNFDLAILQTFESFFNYPRIFPIFLTTPYLELPEGLTVTMSGWGITDDARFPESLHKLDLQIVPFNACNASWNGLLTESMICAAKPNADVCDGDNGGPLIYCGLQVGISSFYRDCDGSFPSVYTNLAHPRIRSFIREITGV